MMLTLEEFIALVILISVFCMTLFAIFTTVYETYMKDFVNDKNCSISKTQKDIQKRLSKAKKVKLCQKK